MLPNERIIVALDFDSGTAALKLVDQLGAAAPYYKVGLQLLTAEGPAIVRALVARQKKVFLDLKLHEIPNSVAGAVAVAGALGVSMVTVHATSGAAVMRAAVEAARPFPDLNILALTVITSLQDQDLAEIGVAGSVRDQVLRLAHLAAAAGCHGVVASPQEAAFLRAVLPAHLLIVTPGVQLPGGSQKDQARTATPAQAIRSGSTHIVLGRAITQAADPGAAYTAVCKEVEQALTAQ